jgi:hypothetical protein
MLIQPFCVPTLGAVIDGHSSEQSDTDTGFTPSTPFSPCRCHSTIVPDPFIPPSHTDVIQSQHVSVSVMNTSGGNFHV